ncbi:MAG: hypothetical protein IT259_14805 [Saprospiraceae bacterium]|nr:hypothetical protein [Saprospiraceae bacterium]
MRHLLLATLCLFVISRSNAQNNARVTGNLQSNGNFFIADSSINAVGTPQYDYQKFGAESWLNLNYSNWGFDVGLRFDVFNNSNLLNPLASFNGQGIGRWYVHKTVGKFDLAGGWLYDQIGSGIIYRSYEERALMIDNALHGVKVGYKFNENWNVRAFAGKQKQQFTQYETNLRGMAFEGFIKPDSTKDLTFAPGMGVVARTYDDATIRQIVGTIAFYDPIDSIGAQYNTYAATVYNTLTAGPISWYVEGALKTNDVLLDPLAEKANGGKGKLRNSEGYTVYTSISYAKSGLGITLEGKRTEDFSFRQNPFTPGVQGAINFLPPMARQNTYRLTARFSPATQELGEQALQLDVKYAVNKKLSLGLNVSEIQLLDGTELYREIAPEITFKQKRKWQALFGFQILKYNMEIYQGKKALADVKGQADRTYVQGLTPYAEFLYRFTPRRSLRVEAQYLDTEEEFGSWAFLLAEVGLAPHWLFYASNMYKMPHKDEEKYKREYTRFDGINYPTVGIVYTHKANRFSLAYVKQVEGINCAGGICRYEPTFHGVQMRVNSSF